MARGLPDDPGAAAGFASALLAWGERARRDLPWRRTRDPWAVLVSELMLQQTQVARVVPAYERFLTELPTVRHAARAPRGQLIELWAGLGYNRRAVHLHGSARTIVERHGGEVPARLEDLLALPGIGPYTARAVLVFAFEQDHGVLDTNAARVLARAVAGRALAPREAQDLADDLTPAGRAWTWNQSMLDLGATVCTKRSPHCPDCPVAPHCAWWTADRAEPDPVQGTAGSSGTQPRFAGSDRQGRGRIVAALRRGPIAADRAATVAGWDHDPARADRAVAALVADGVIERVGGMLRLPR